MGGSRAAHFLMEKRCRGCGEIKTAEFFHKRTRAADGRQSRCKECACRTAREWGAKNKGYVAEKNRERYLRTQQVVAERSRAWVAAHPERALAFGRKYREANPDKERARARRYREAHREAARAYRVEYFAKNPGLRNTWDARRRAQEKRAMPCWANEFFIAEAYHLAQLREQHTGFGWHVDHVIPLQNPLVCGLHVENNLQVIPATENWKKSNSFSP